MVKRNKPKPVIISPLAKEDIANILFWLSENWNHEIIDEFLQKLEIFYHIIQLIQGYLVTIISGRISENLRFPNKTLFIIETEEK